MPPAGNKTLWAKLGLDTNGAIKAARGFFRSFTSMSISAAGAVNTGRSMAGARALGSGGGFTAPLRALGGSFTAPAGGEVTAGITGLLGRLGSFAFNPLIQRFDSWTAANRVHEKLQPIAEAQALATGKIDKESLLQLREVFQELEHRKRRGATELAALLGEQDKDKEVWGWVSALVGAVRELTEVIRAPR